MTIPSESTGDAQRPTETFEIGRQMADADAADARHQDAHINASPLRGVAYDDSLREHDLFRFVSSPRDATLHALVEQCRLLGPSDRATVRSNLTQDDFYTLITYARRCVVQTLRTSDAVQAMSGLEAMSLVEKQRIDWRDAAWVAAMLSYALVSVHSDPSTPFAEAASRCEPGIAEILERFARAPATTLAPWGQRAIESEGNIVLASDGGKPFEPSVDLVDIARDITTLLEQDVWKVHSTTVAADISPVWFRRGDRDSVESALERTRGTITLSARLTATLFPDPSSQHFMACVVEATDDRDARVLANSLGSTVGEHFAVLGIQSGPIFAGIIARSFVKGRASYEHGTSLERFRSGLESALSARVG